MASNHRFTYVAKYHEGLEKEDKDNYLYLAPGDAWLAYPFGATPEEELSRLEREGFEKNSFTHKEKHGYEAIFFVTPHGTTTPTRRIHGED